MPPTHIRDIMNQTIIDPVKYSIMDPTGNVTALVESPVGLSMQPDVADRIMKKHPEVEQAGFLIFEPDPDGSCRPSLRMAGGEFCGNASMCAAALYMLRSQTDGAGNAAASSMYTDTDCFLHVFLTVSGAEHPVEVRLKKDERRIWHCGVKMPEALEITPVELDSEGVHAALPLVRMEGISHIIIEPSSPFFALLENRRAAEQTVRNWCRELSAAGLGLMFLEQGTTGSTLTPLVYVPGSGTVFWENSCASGTSAAGMYLADKKNKTIDLTMKEPGGYLRVISEPTANETWLHGTTEWKGEFELC